MSHETYTPALDVGAAPVATGRTLRMRQNLPYQAVRFVAFSLRLLRMVLKRHG